MTIFEVNDYRIFMKDALAALPNRGRGEIARIAGALRVNPTLISQVLHGKKNLTLEQAYDSARYLDLSDAEVEHFVDLVQLERAGTERLKNLIKLRLERSRKSGLKLANRLRHDHVLTTTEKAIFYSSSIYSAIRLFCSIGPGKNINEVTSFFQLSNVKATEVLQFLVKAGLCTFDGKRYRMGPRRIHLESDSPFVIRHHLNCRHETLKRVEKISEEDLLFGALVALSESDFRAIRERIVALLKEVSSVVDRSPSEQLGILNIDWLKY